MVYSAEEPIAPTNITPNDCRLHDVYSDKNMHEFAGRRTIPASNAFVPAAAGIIVGGEVIKDLIRNAGTMRSTLE